jgi:hypothetical protein
MTSATLIGRRVDIYLNLHKPGRLSLRSAEADRRGLVIGHALAVDLLDVIMHVSAAGQQRVRANRCKEVHAWIRGTITAVALDGSLAAWNRKAARLIDRQAVRLRYNPYETSEFICRDSLIPVRSAQRVVAIGGNVVAVL